MKRLKTILSVIILLVFSFSLMSCGKNTGGGGSGSSTGGGAGGLNSKLDYTIKYDIETKEVAKTADDITDRCIELDGYLLESKVVKNETAKLVYKIPSNNLNSFLKTIDNLDADVTKDIKADDSNLEENTYKQELIQEKASIEAELLLLEEIFESETATSDEKSIALSKKAEYTQRLNKINNLLSNMSDTLSTVYVSIAQPELTQVQSYTRFMKNAGITLGTILLYTAPFLAISGLIIGLYFGVIAKYFTKKEEK